jgi:hypothetical protein
MMMGFQADVIAKEFVNNGAALKRDYLVLFITMVIWILT